MGQGMAWPGRQEPTRRIFWRHRGQRGPHGSLGGWSGVGSTCDVSGGCQAACSAAVSTGFSPSKARTRLARTLAAGCNQPKVQPIHRSRRRSRRPSAFAVEITGPARLTSWSSLVRQHVMNPFVDYQKRGVELPAGCTDLIDVLRLGRSSDPRPSGAATTLADVGSFLSLFVSSSAAVRSLWIFHSATSWLGLFCGKHGLRALVNVDASREQAVRGVLSHAGFVPDQDDTLENNARGLQFVIPSTSGIEHFVRELLTHGFGATQVSPLEFHFHERKAA